ncbi:MAG: HD domain-containing protein [Bacillota bacterium]|nr:HD domain-containing protein [Bacillota bacterium]
MERINAIIESKEYKHYLAKIKDYEKTRVFCCHDWEHFLAVCRISYIIVLEAENKGELQYLSNSIIKELTYATGFLHDIGRWVQYETGEDHAAASGRLAVPLLKQANFTDDEIKLIVTAIREHRGAYAESFLGKIISRADDIARQCNQCQVKLDCYKLDKMPGKGKGIIY